MRLIGVLGWILAGTPAAEACEWAGRYEGQIEVGDALASIRSGDVTVRSHGEAFDVRARSGGVEVTGTARLVELWVAQPIPAGPLTWFVGTLVAAPSGEGVTVAPRNVSQIAAMAYRAAPPVDCDVVRLAPADLSGFQGNAIREGVIEQATQAAAAPGEAPVAELPWGDVDVLEERGDSVRVRHEAYGQVVVGWVPASAVSPPPSWVIGGFESGGGARVAPARLTCDHDVRLTSLSGEALGTIFAGTPFSIEPRLVVWSASGIQFGTGARASKADTKACAVAPPH